MIKSTLELSGLNVTIEEPALTIIVKDISAMLGVPRDTRMMKTDKDGYFKTSNWKLGKNAKKLLHSNDLFVMAQWTKDTSGDNLISLTKRYTDTAPILQDNEIRYTLQTIEANETYTMNIKYLFKNRTEASIFEKRLEIRRVNSMDAFKHDVVYNYTMPLPELEKVHEIYTIKKEMTGYTGTFVDYLKTITDARAIVVSNVDGEEDSAKLHFKEYKVNVEGLIISEIDDMKANINTDTGYWEVNIIYRVDILVPYSVLASNPMFIYNQPLSDRFIKPIAKHIESNTAQQTLSQYSLSLFNTETAAKYFRMLLSPEDMYLNIISYDRHEPIEPRAGMTRVFSVPVTITLLDKKTLFNLNDLPEYKINDDVINFIKNSEYEYITNQYESLFNIELITNDESDYGARLSLDADLNLTSDIDLDITKMYRVMFNITTDFSWLKQEAKDRVMRYGYDISQPLKIMSLITGMSNQSSMNMENGDIYKDYSLRDVTYQITQNNLITNVYTMQISNILANTIQPRR